MTKSQRTSALWFLGGVALVIGGVLANPVRLLSIIAGAVFFVVGIVTTLRDPKDKPPVAK